MKLALALMLLLVSSTASAETSEDKEKLKFELLSKLMDNAKVSLKGKEFCESFIQNKQDNVGKFVAWSLSFYSKGQDNSVDAKCEKNSCTVNFAADSKGESPWSCGLRFNYDSKTRKIQTSSIQCIGTC